MTVGILIKHNLPREIVEINTGFKKQLAEDYLDINLLTKKGIQAELLDGKLEHWKIDFSLHSSKSSLTVILKETRQYLETVQSNSMDQQRKLNLMGNFVLRKCRTMYVFVIVISFILENDQPVNKLKHIVEANIVELNRII